MAIRSCPLLIVALALPACRPGAPTTTPPPSGCEITVSGPLITTTNDPSPAPMPTGGAIVDGDYDMVAYVVHGQDPGTSPSDPDGFRFAARFVTTERSPNHAQGRVAVMIDVPPAQSCKAAPFATIQTQLRGIDSRGEISSTPYSASDAQIVLHQDGIDIVMRRRR